MLEDQFIKGYFWYNNTYNHVQMEVKSISRFLK